MACQQNLDHFVENVGVIDDSVLLRQEGVELVLGSKSGPNLQFLAPL